MYTINKGIYGDYGKYIVNAADNLLDEFDNPTGAAAETAMIDSYKWVLNKLLDNTIIGHIESIITLSNAIIKSNPNYASQIENADLMNTVHALIDVENVFLNEFVDSYHDYIHYLEIEDGSSSLMLWELMYASTNNNPQKAVEAKAISEMRNALEMFLKTSLRNKTYVYHFNYFNDSFWTLTTAAQELKEDIYKTYALLSQLISTRDYDKLLYLDETFGSMYSNEYGQIRDKISDIILTKEILSYKEEDTSTSSESIETTTETGNHSQNTIFAGGNGTQKNPYKVSTPEQLNAVRNNLSAHYVQINDIDMSCWDNWVPIGSVVPYYNGMSISSESEYFTGSYDGENFKISNLKIYNDAYSPETDCYGLFAGVSSGAVVNVNLVEINYEIIKNNEDYEYSPMQMRNISVCVGGLVGKLDDKAKITNCSVSGEIFVIGSHYDYVGGIIGYGNASYCTNYTNINIVADMGNSSNGVYCGGIAGSSIYREDEFIYCKNYGNIDVSCVTFVYCGGIVGEHGYIEFCENYGNILGRSTFASWSSSFAGNCNVGGIVGATFTNTPINCINFGNITSYTNHNGVGGVGYAGGIAGFNGYNGNGILKNNYNCGESIIAQGLDGRILRKGGAGRIAGYSIRTENCYSINNTTVNDVIPTQHNTPDDINGGTMTKSEIDMAIQSLL